MKHLLFALLCGDVYGCGGRDADDSSRTCRGHVYGSRGLAAAEVSVYVGDGGLNQSYLSVLEEAGLHAPRVVRRAAPCRDTLCLRPRRCARQRGGVTCSVSMRRASPPRRARPAGLLLSNALQTLRQVVAADDEGVRYPAARWTTRRATTGAYMLDESRHFHGMDLVKRLLDEMARLKMNVFHWHLVDDPGWRIEYTRPPC